MCGQGFQRAGLDFGGITDTATALEEQSSKAVLVYFTLIQQFILISV